MNKLLKALLPLVAASGALFATQEAKQVPSVVQQYDHRMVVFHPAHLAYEYMPNEDLYIGADLFGAMTYQPDLKKSVSLASLELRMGRTYFMNGQDRVRPILGAGVFRNFDTINEWNWCGFHNEWHKIGEFKHPFIAYGLVGVMMEREFNDRLALGVNAKLIAGGIAGKTYGAERQLYYGVDISIPFTIRMGENRNWDLRLEPFAIVLNSGNQYIGHRSALAYRF